MLQISPTYFSNLTNDYQQKLILGLILIILGLVIIIGINYNKRKKYVDTEKLAMVVLAIPFLLSGIFTSIASLLIINQSQNPKNIYQEYQVNGQIVMTSKTDGYFGKTNQSTVKLPDGLTLDLNKDALDKIVNQTPNKQDLTQGSIIQYHTDQKGQIIIDQTIIHPLDNNNAVNAQVNVVQTNN